MRIWYPQGAACLPPGSYLFCNFTLRRFRSEAEKITKKSKTEKIAAGRFSGWEGSA
jgi:hypothetical protein